MGVEIFRGCHILGTLIDGAAGCTLQQSHSVSIDGELLSAAAWRSAHLDHALQALLGHGGGGAKGVEVAGHGVDGRVDVAVGGAAAEGGVAAVPRHPVVDLLAHLHTRRAMGWQAGENKTKRASGIRCRLGPGKRPRNGRPGLQEKALGAPVRCVSIANVGASFLAPTKST